MVIVTEWEQFRALDLGRVSDLMACPVIVDLRNIYRPEEMKRHGFAYSCVGHAPTQQPVNAYIPPVRADSAGGGAVRCRCDRKAALRRQRLQ